jgi:hypothetical protein
MPIIPFRHQQSPIGLAVETVIRRAAIGMAAYAPSLGGEISGLISKPRRVRR